MLADYLLIVVPVGFNHSFISTQRDCFSSALVLNLSSSLTSLSAHSIQTLSGSNAYPPFYCCFPHHHHACYLVDCKLIKQSFCYISYSCIAFCNFEFNVCSLHYFYSLCEYCLKMVRKKRSSCSFIFTSTTAQRNNFKNATNKLAPN